MTKKAIGIITFTIILFTISQNLTVVAEYIGKFLSIIAPILVGLVLAFILNILLNVIERKITKIANKNTKIKIKNVVRPISLIITVIIAIAILALLLLTIIPEIYDTILLCIEKVPTYYCNIVDWLDNLIVKYDLSIDIDTLKDFEINIGTIVDTAKSNFTSEKINELLGNTVSVTSSVFTAIANFGIGFVFAIYFLAQKERINKFIYKILEKILSKEKYNKVREICSLIYNSFYNFIAGQALDAMILGFLCFIVMSLFRLPSAAIISLLISITAMLPIVGAFIGEGVGLLIIAMVDPWKALFFIILMTILQIIDNNFIYPKVMGESVGLPRILVLTAVIIGGKIGGALGILLGVPALSVIYILIKNWINNKEYINNECVTNTEIINEKSCYSENINNN